MGNFFIDTVANEIHPNNKYTCAIDVLPSLVYHKAVPFFKVEIIPFIHFTVRNTLIFLDLIVRATPTHRNCIVDYTGCTLCVLFLLLLLMVG